MTLAIWGCAASCLVRAMPADATDALSTVPDVGVHQNQDVVRPVVELRGEDTCRTDRLLRRGVEPTPGELRGDVSPEQTGHDDEESGDHHDGLPMPDRGPGHVAEHTLGRGRSRLRMPREPTHGM